jgi:hypothetical protein
MSPRSDPAAQRHPLDAADEARAHALDGTSAVQSSGRYNARPRSGKREYMELLYRDILVSRDADLGIVAMNRPERRNPSGSRG